MAIKTKMKLSLWFMGGAGLVVIISVIIALYSYNQYMALSEQAGVAAEKEQVQLTQKISKFMLLPDETPTLATVTDTAKLKGQLFFSKAMNGDKVLVYPKAKKAILYRPSENKVIEVGVLTLGQNTSLGDQTVKPEITPTASNNLKLVVLNGTEKVGLATQLAEKITKETKSEVLTVDNTANREYTKSLIVDLSKGKKLTKVRELATRYDLELAAVFPPEEARLATVSSLLQGADSVIIVGN